MYEACKAQRGHAVYGDDVTTPDCLPRLTAHGCGLVFLYYDKALATVYSYKTDHKSYTVTALSYFSMIFAIVEFKTWPE